MKLPEKRPGEREQNRTGVRLHVLGSGTCLGPLPGAVPRMPPLFAVELPGALLLLDCSEGARFRLAAAGLDAAAVSHVAVTHPHADHAALPQFLQGRSCEAIYRPGRSLALSLFLPRASAEALPALFAFHQPEDGGAGPSRYALSVVGVEDSFSQELAPGVVLRAYAVHHGHGRNPAVAYRVEAGDVVLAYSGDTGLCDGVIAAARGATLFVCEASTRIGEDMARGYGHLSPIQAGAVARDAGARSLVLTHHTGLDADEAMLVDCRASGYGGPTRVARDGDVYELRSP